MTFNLDDVLYKDYWADGWLMEHSERLSLIGLIQSIQPQCAIEIGSHMGSSASVASQYAKQLYILDVDPAVKDRLAPLPKTEVIIGDSAKTFPDLLRRVKESGQELNWVLIDGDHTTEGVRKDCEAILSYVPTSPIYIIMHDSFNPDVREGIRTAGWEQNPHVALLDLDFVPGRIFGRKVIYKQMWGGLALAVMTPETRKEPLQVKAEMDLQYEMLYSQSGHVHNPPLHLRIIGKLALMYRNLVGK